MKPAALILILAVCSFLGLYKSFSLKKRAAELRSVIASLTRIKTGITYGKRDISALISEAAKDGDGNIFTEISQTEGDTLKKRYEKASTEYIKHSFLTESDRQLLDVFFASAGKSGADDQAYLCSEAVNGLSQKLTEAEGAYKKYGGVFARSGILAGLFIVIMLL